MSDTELIYGGTVRDLQLTIGRIAHRGEQRFGDIADAVRGRVMTEEELDQQLDAHGTAHFGWSLVAILSMLSEEHPEVAGKVGNIVQDIGENGGLGWKEWGEDIYVEVAGEPSDAA